MAPLYPPGLDEIGAVANSYPASWMCIKKESRPGTISITAMYNFCTRYNFFNLAVNFLKNENKKRI